MKELIPQIRVQATSEVKDLMSKQLQEQLTKARDEYKSQYAEAVQAYERQLSQYRQTIQTLQSRQTEMLDHVAEMNANCSSLMAKQAVQLSEACTLDYTEKMRELRGEFSRQLSVKELDWQAYVTQCTNLTARVAQQAKQSVESERSMCERRLDAQRSAYQRVYNETYFLTLCSNATTRRKSWEDHDDERKKAVQEALASSKVVEMKEEDPYHYDVDFALVGSGAKIIASLTSPTFFPTQLQFEGVVKTFLMGVGLGGWAAAVPPSPLRPLFHDVLHLYPLTGAPLDALSPHTAKGHCWPMEGSSGQLTVSFPYPITLTAFSIDHIPRSEAEDWSSAPRAFTLSTSSHPLMAEDVYVVYGGEFDGVEEEGRQKFPLPIPQRNVSAVTLRIYSNHGHAQYTCLYKLRVHGYV
eukprot:gene34537-41818_t